MKQVFCYLRGTKNLRLVYSKATKSGLVGYADAGYRFDSHKACSQICYVFTYNSTTISWRFMKKSLVATSSNHYDIVALHEAGRECVWLMSVIEHIQSTCGLNSNVNVPTIIYKDNKACIAQVK